MKFKEIIFLDNIEKIIRIQNVYLNFEGTYIFLSVVIEEYAEDITQQKKIIIKRKL